MLDKVLNKIALFLTGILIASITFAITIKIISNTFGLILAFLICSALIYFGITKTKKHSNKRTIVYGIITTMATITLIAIVLWRAISQASLT